MSIDDCRHAAQRRRGQAAPPSAAARLRADDRQPRGRITDHSQESSDRLAAQGPVPFTR
jgi:hypothetical protein